MGLMKPTDPQKGTYAKDKAALWREINALWRKLNQRQPDNDGIVGEKFQVVTTGWGDFLIPDEVTFANTYATPPSVFYGYSIADSGWTEDPDDTDWNPVPRCFGGVASWITDTGDPDGNVVGCKLLVVVDSMGYQAGQVAHNFLFTESP